LELDLGGARYDVENVKPCVFANGRRLADADLDLTRERLVVRLPESARSTTRPLALCWRCQPLQPRTLGSPDPRDLGLPVFGVREACSLRPTAQAA
jgi:hypothetical protein